MEDQSSNSWILLFEKTPQEGQSCWITDGESVLWARWDEGSFYNEDCWLDSEKEFVLWMPATMPNAPGLDALPEPIRQGREAEKERIRKIEEESLRQWQAKIDTDNAERDRLNAMNVEDQWPMLEKLMANAERPEESSQ